MADRSLLEVSLRQAQAARTADLARSIDLARTAALAHEAISQAPAVHVLVGALGRHHVERLIGDVAPHLDQAAAFRLRASFPAAFWRHVEMVSAGRLRDRARRHRDAAAAVERAVARHRSGLDRELWDVVEQVAAGRLEPDTAAGMVTPGQLEQLRAAWPAGGWPDPAPAP